MRAETVEKCGKCERSFIGVNHSLKFFPIPRTKRLWDKLMINTNMIKVKTEKYEPLFYKNAIFKNSVTLTKSFGVELNITKMNKTEDF